MTETKTERLERYGRLIVIVIWVCIGVAAVALGVWYMSLPTPACRNETLSTSFSFPLNEPNVYCHINETLTQAAIEANYPYTIYTCVKEICDS